MHCCFLLLQTCDGLLQQLLPQAICTARRASHYDLSKGSVAQGSAGVLHAGH
jgi:hypothetical protein